MTDTALNSPPIASIAQRLKSIRTGFRFNKPDAASFQMLSLARTNLGVRLRAIDETSLTSDCQKKIYATVAEMLKAPSESSTATFEWDDIYKANSLIALLYSGEQLRREVDARLGDFATVDQAGADNFRRDNQELLKRSSDGSNPGLDDSFRALLLRILEAVHWNAKKKYLARPLGGQAATRILICLLTSLVLLIAPYGFLISDYATDGSVHKVWSLFALYTALTAGLLGRLLQSFVRHSASVGRHEPRRSVHSARMDLHPPACRGRRMRRAHCLYLSAIGNCRGGTFSEIR